MWFKIRSVGSGPFLDGIRMNMFGKKAVMDESCKFEIGNEGSNINLIIDCKECSKSHSLSDRECLQRIMKIIRKQHTIDNIIIKQLQETQHFERSMDTLLSMREILDFLEVSGSREPMEYDAKDQALQRSCHKCKISPNKLFSSLSDNFEKGTIDFYREMKSISNNLKNPLHTKHCEKCIDETAHDLNSATDKYYRLVTKVLKYGYFIDIDLEKV